MLLVDHDVGAEVKPTVNDVDSDGMEFRDCDVKVKRGSTITIAAGKTVAG